MNIQLVNFSFPEVFNRYCKKYNILSESYESGLLGLELHNVKFENIIDIQKNIFNKIYVIDIANDHEKESADLLVITSIGSLKDLMNKINLLKDKDLGVKIKNVIRNYCEYDNITINVHNKEFINTEFYIVGILNITPDSFSDGGKFLNTEKAISHALNMKNDGADIIDIGGESTRPGAEKVSVEEEFNRVIPVIKELIQITPDAIISVDTTKKEIALEALKQGAKIVNDISAGSFEPEILDIVNEFNATIVLMHMKGIPQTMQNNPKYEDVVVEVYNYLEDKVQLAKKAGIKNIIVDPGIGFGKRVKDNFEILKRLDEFKGLGSPIMIGVSRKSFIGKSLNLEINERDTPTAIAETIAIQNGARFIRTHNVKNAVNLRKLLNYTNKPEEVHV